MPTRLPLVILPTPLHRLDILSKAYNVNLWIKRDDLTGFAFGGNKGRKLEYLMAEAVAMGATAVVTCGSSQSNFVRQLGAACSRLEMRCVATVMDNPFDTAAGRPPAGHGGSSGNVLLDQVLGVELKKFPDDDWEILYDHLEKEAKSLESAGEKVYRIPIGGSSGLGAYSFYEAAQELKRQADEPFDTIVFATSSGSTQVGLVYGFHDTSTRVLGIACDPEPEIANDFAKTGEDLAKILGVAALPVEAFDIDFNFVGPGYGIASIEGNAAIEVAARKEGVFLDPVYSGKAFAGLLSHLKAGDIGKRVLFWHTGGLPALFA